MFSSRVRLSPCASDLPSELLPANDGLLTELVNKEQIFQTEFYQRVDGIKRL